MAKTAKAKGFRSGYARDVMPERLEAAERDGLTVPIADEKGGQEGIVPPRLRIYGKANYKAVTLSEAEANMAKRARGEMPPIKNGLDDSSVMKFPDERRGRPITVGKPDKPGFDPLGELSDPQPGDLTAEEQALARAGLQTSPVATTVQMPAFMPAQTTVMETPEQIYLRQRNRVTFELQDGTISVPCIDVKESTYGVVILLPLLSESGIMIPKPGTELTVTVADRSWRCFAPGANFELPELSIMIIAFIKA
jgi:hypothetical protein